MLRTSFLIALAAPIAVGATLPPRHHAATTAAVAAVPGGFGRAVAVAGDYAFVGEPGAGRFGGGGEPGIVHVYRRSGTTWREVAKLTSPRSGPGDGFGASLAADGTTLLVGQTGGMPLRGAPGGAQPPAPVADMVHVFRRGADGRYTAAGTWDSPFAAGAAFGVAVALSGNDAVVGAPNESNGGAVVAFRRAANGGWSQAGTLSAQGIAADDEFGMAVTLDGNRAVVGAPGHDAHGAAFVFARGTDGAWAQDGASISARRAPENAQFGSAVLVKGDRVLVGAPGTVFAAPAANARPQGGGRGGFAGGMGMLVEFTRNNAGAWVEGANITPYDFPTIARLGTSIAMAGSELLIGAPMADGVGRIYSIARDTSGDVTAMTKLTVNPAGGGGGFRGPQFAAALAASGNDAVVGMPGDAGGLGTVQFLARVGGKWVSRGTDHPPVPDRFPMVAGKEIVCGADGRAGAFPCSNTGLLSFVPIQKLGGDRASRMNDNWGWTDPTTGREYALAGRNDGTAFVDITDAEHPKYLGNLPKTPGVPSGIWRDIKVYKNHAYIVADGSGAHGMQVFDLTKLRNVKAPQTFKPVMTYHDINSAHNIVINENTGFAYVVGASGGGTTCGGGLHMVDIRDPEHPKFAGCFADTRTGRNKTGYSHDATCITYHGPDTRYTGREICVGSNETAIAISDVTDKSKPVALSFISYPNVGYAHQGWFTEDQKYFYLDDELDEISALRDSTGTNQAAKGTRTMIYDVTKLDDPVLAKEYIGTVRSSDHNLYVKGDKLYQANYGSGLRIIDISDPLNPKEVAYLDTYPDDDNEPAMHGAWSNYPFFPSGNIIVTSSTEGLFVVKDRSKTKVVP